MIGTHNSYTFLLAKNKVFEVFSFLWRTQTKNIKQQKDSGVTYFDVRIRKKKDKWVACHGIVDLDLEFNSIEEILNIFTLYKVRIILERGNLEDEIEFIKIIGQLVNHSNLVFAAIKNNWIIIWNVEYKIVDYTYLPWVYNLSFWENIKNFNFFSTIKRWARHHNPKITKDLIEDSQTVHFIDYI